MTGIEAEYFGPDIEIYFQKKLPGLYENDPSVNS